MVIGKERVLSLGRLSQAIGRVAGVCLLFVLYSYELSAAQEKKERVEPLLGFYVLGSLPSDKNPSFQGREAINASIDGGVGAGIKVSLFPPFTKHLVGLDVEYFGHGGGIAFPVAGGARASTDLTVLNSMFSLIVRYPGERLRPYAGAGLGLSSGILTGADIPGRSDSDFETSMTLGYQFLGGLQVQVTDRYYVFSEYKYFGANYHWKELSLDFRTQYVLGGVGIRF